MEIILIRYPCVHDLSRNEIKYVKSPETMHFKGKKNFFT